MEYFNKIYDVWRPIQYEKYTSLLEQWPHVFNGLILDLGSASCFLHDFLTEKGVECNIVAMDVDKESIKECNAKSKILAKGENLPFKKEVFDSIICVDVLHLLKAPIKLDVVKKNGFVVVGLVARYRDVLENFLTSLNQEEFEVIDTFEVIGREHEIFVILKRLA